MYLTCEELRSLEKELQYIADTYQVSIDLSDGRIRTKCGEMHGALVTEELTGIKTYFEGFE